MSWRTHDTAASIGVAMVCVSAYMMSGWAGVLGVVGLTLIVLALIMAGSGNA